MDSKLKWQLAGAGLIAALAVASSAVGEPKEGNYDVTACSYGTAKAAVKLSGSDWAAINEHSGTVLSNPSGGMFDRSVFHCVALIASLGGKRVNTSVCVATDPDGDKRMNYFAIGVDGKRVRQFVGGTGKYAGMSETNKMVRIGPFPKAREGTYQGCSHQTGTYQLK